MDEIIEKLPNHAAILLSISAINDCAEYDDPELIGRIAMDSLKQAIKSALDAIAASRSLDRFKDF